MPALGLFVRGSAPPATSFANDRIVRPTMIYGTPGDRNMIRLVEWINRWPVLPVFGDSRSLQQPVHVKDVAWAGVKCLVTPATIHRQFNTISPVPNHSLTTRWCSAGHLASSESSN